MKWIITLGGGSLECGFIFLFSYFCCLLFEHKRAATFGNNAVSGGASVMQEREWTLQECKPLSRHKGGGPSTQWRGKDSSVLVR